MLKKLGMSWCLVMVIQSWTAAAQGVESPTNDTLRASNAVPSWKSLDRWSFQFGVGFITESAVDDIGSLRGDLADGDAEGEVYLMQASYKVARWVPSVFGHPMELDGELPVVLGVV